MFDYFLPKTLETVDSLFNGKISVVKQNGRTSIWVNSFEQSGPLVAAAWKKPLNRLSGKKVRTILVLGFGAGAVLPLLRNLFPQAQVTGVEIDRFMPELGEKYLGTGKYSGLKIIIADAFDYLKNNAGRDNKSDLVLVDLYTGGKRENKEESSAFLNKIYQITSEEGIVIFNHLTIQNNKNELSNFLDKVGGIFAISEVVTSQYNDMVICSRG